MCVLVCHVKTILTVGAQLIKRKLTVSVTINTILTILVYKPVLKTCLLDQIPNV